jgi:hypothetical protein
MLKNRIRAVQVARILRGSSKTLALKGAWQKVAKLNDGFVGRGMMRFRNQTDIHI